MVNFVNQFSGGISQDDNFVSKWQCIYSHGFDATRNPWELQKMPPIVQKDNVAESDYIPSIFAPESLVWYGTYDGYIKEVAWWTTKANTSSGLPIIDGILFLGKFYAFTNRAVYSYTYTAGSLSSQTTFVADGWADRNYRHPVIYQWGEMYFPWTASTSKNIHYVDSTGTLQTLFSTDFSSDVRALSIQGSNLRIYTENLLSIMDIWSKTISYSQVLPFTVNCVKSDGNVDYAITDSNQLYVMSGLWWKKIGESNYSETLSRYTSYSTKMTFRSGLYWTPMCFSDDRLYIVENDAPRYLIYWNKFDGITKSFSYWPIHDDNSTTPANAQEITNVYAIFAINGSTYLSYKCNWFYRLGQLSIYNTTDKCYESVYITPHNDFWDYSLQKHIEEIRVGKEWIGWELWASIDNNSFESVDLLDQEELENKTTDFKNTFRKLSLMIKQYDDGDKVVNIDVRFNKNQT